MLHRKEKQRQQKLRSNLYGIHKHLMSIGGSKKKQSYFSAKNKVVHYFFEIESERGIKNHAQSRKVDKKAGRK